MSEYYGGCWLEIGASRTLYAVDSASRVISPNPGNLGLGVMHAGGVLLSNHAGGPPIVHNPIRTPARIPTGVLPCTVNVKFTFSPGLYTLVGVRVMFTASALTLVTFKPAWAF